jgi:hypothetical protein
MQGIEIPRADKREDRIARAQKFEAAKLGGLINFVKRRLSAPFITLAARAPKAAGPHH